jgi:OOP family OmpA-OmpF porin
MSFRNALLATTVLILPVAVEAQTPPAPVKGIYFGAAGGIETNPNVNSVVSDSPGAAGRAAPTANLSTGTGGAAVSSLGYGLGNGLRVEVEGNYRNSSVR